MAKRIPICQQKVEDPVAWSFDAILFFLLSRQKHKLKFSDQCTFTYLLARFCSRN